MQPWFKHLVVGQFQYILLFACLFFCANCNRNYITTDFMTEFLICCLTPLFLEKTEQEPDNMRQETDKELSFDPIIMTLSPLSKPAMPDPGAPSCSPSVKSIFCNSSSKHKQS